MDNFPITFGTYRIITKEDIYNGLDMALSKGIRHIDTAELYKNHHLIGEVLPKLLDKYQLRRADIKITSKISFKKLLLPDEDIIRAINQIYEDLKIDYIDTILIHAPTTDENNKRIWKLLSQYREKSINNIGVSNFRYEHIESLNNYIKENNLRNIYINQIELNPFVLSRQQKLIEYCKENNILISLYGLFYNFNKYDKPIKRNHLIEWTKYHNFIPNIKTLDKECLDEILYNKKDGLYIDYMNQIPFVKETGFQFTKYNTN
jgi:diketogulonate reductase-like aldo/keto reductase